MADKFTVILSDDEEEQGLEHPTVMMKTGA